MGIASCRREKVLLLYGSSMIVYVEAKCHLHASRYEKTVPLREPGQREATMETACMCLALCLRGDYQTYRGLQKNSSEFAPGSPNLHLFSQLNYQMSLFTLQGIVICMSNYVVILFVFPLFNCLEWLFFFSFFFYFIIFV